MKRRTLLATAPALAPALVSFRTLAAAPGDLLNASYSATVELFRAYNTLFATSWREKPARPSPSIIARRLRRRRRAR